MDYYSRSKRVGGSPGKWGRLVRLFLMVFIFLGLGYSVYTLFRSEDLYVSIQGLIDDKKFAEVERLTSKLINHNPRDVRVLRLRGKNYFQQAMRIDHAKKDQTEEGWTLFKKAVQSLKEAILLDKSGLISSVDYMIIGFSYMRKGDNYFSEALRYLGLAEKHNHKDKALLRDEENPFFSLNSLYKLQGYLYYKIGKYKKALSYYKKANKRKHVLNYLYIGLCQRNLNRYKKALKTFAFVYDYASDEKLKMDSLRNLGWLYFHLGRYSEAAAVYRKSVSMDTNYAEGLYWIGMVAEKRGNHSEARKLLKQCLQVDTNFGPAILKMKNLKKRAKKR